MYDIVTLTCFSKGGDCRKQSEKVGCVARRPPPQPFELQGLKQDQRNNVDKLKRIFFVAQNVKNQNFQDFQDFLQSDHHYLRSLNTMFGQFRGF